MRNMFKAVRPSPAKPPLVLVTSAVSGEAANANADADAREVVITDRDAAAALGLDPDKSVMQLWREKSGLIDPNPDSRSGKDAGAGFWRSLLEPLIASVYSRRTGYRVRRINEVISHPGESWMQAILGWEVIGVVEVQILICEVVRQENAGEWSDGIPVRLRANVMHLLGVTGCQAAEIAALVCGHDLQIYRIKRDDELIKKVIDVERSLRDLVRRKEAPANQTAQLRLGFESLQPPEAFSSTA